MEPKGVTLDEATANLLAAAPGDCVELCDASGNVVGYAVTRAWLTRMKQNSPWLAGWEDRGSVDGPHIVDGPTDQPAASD